MRYGFTTGSCAAAAAKAAAYMLLTGRKKENISIRTPKEIEFRTEIVDITMGEEKVRCGVVKDGGDDPDVTTGAVVYAEVSFSGREDGSVCIEGGEGVGKVTMPGLDQDVGNAAINSMPRKMIREEVTEVMEILDCHDGLQVVISVPGGAQIAEKTFNPRLGIVGGISILGTSGIVEPMSSQALLDTIRVELNQKRALGEQSIVIAPGNYGLDFMRETYSYDLEKAVKCSNFIGQSLDMAAELGFEKVLLCGHVGKLIKVAGGIMNTHSHEADCRMEIMTACALKAGAGLPVLHRIADCISTDAAYEIIKKAGVEERFMSIVMERIAMYLGKRTGGKLRVECIVFSKEHGKMGETAGVEALLKELRKESTENE